MSPLTGDSLRASDFAGRRALYTAKNAGRNRVETVGGVTAATETVIRELP